MTLKCLAVTAALALAGCGDDGGPVRYSASEPVQTSRVSIPMASVSLREVSLPAYASEEGIAVSNGAGAITTGPNSIWADDPTRAVTLRLTNALADLTGRLVASEPWPFRDEPETMVEVRVEEFVAEAGGQFVAQGRYYVAHNDEARTEKALSFRITEPFDPAGGFIAIAAARTRVISALARDIAVRGLS
ncbi:hypothetical protein C8D95_10271 [Silicimonas algicola]|uniref:ABC-type transport auxiliary lipoprotein component domain-containing protein n=2 Tax=Silicimonas algicola TaxID=1826607 RepID=A0A316G8X3_9RHOB|nr:hypothetical protein C8D95_10271 [Silicimonas algicola]